MALVQVQEWDKSILWDLLVVPNCIICRVTWLKILLGDVILWKIVTSDVKVE